MSFFAAMARIYASAEPPASPMLFDYGAGFPHFIHGFEPAAALPYLRDVARIERAWVEAYHAPEARSLHPAAFAQVSPEDLPNLRVLLHPSLRLVRSPFPALTIWQRNADGGEPRGVDLGAGGEDALIIRSGAEVELRSLPPGGADFLQALCDGGSMLEATEAAMGADRRFGLSVNLSGLMLAGAFVGLDPAIEPASSPPYRPSIMNVENSSIPGRLSFSIAAAAARIGGLGSAAAPPGHADCAGAALPAFRIHALGGTPVNIARHGLFVRGAIQAPPSSAASTDFPHPMHWPSWWARRRSCCPPCC